MRNQRYADAAGAYGKALALVPGDAVAAKGLADAQLAQRGAAGQFDLQMARGAAAMRDARFKDAMDAFQEAARLNPTSDAAAQGLRLAIAAYEVRASYIAAMRRGKLALDNLLLADAVTAYTEAL